MTGMTGLASLAEEGAISIVRRESLTGYYPPLHRLLDVCYPRPPRDVFYRLVERYRPGFPAWLALGAADNLVGFVYLVPNSKGGTLETLAVDPGYRSQGIAQALVRRLLEATPGLISLTTRIPDFFQRQGFEIVRILPDGTLYMIHLRFPPVAHMTATRHLDVS